MAAKTKTQTKTEAPAAKPKRTVVTPIGTAKYPRLQAPDTKFKPEGEYSVKLVLPAKEAAPLVAEIERRRDGYIEWLQSKGEKVQKKRADLPFQEDEETGEVSFTFKSKAKKRESKGSDVMVRVPPPKVVDSKGNKVTAFVGGGSRVRVAFTVRGWQTPALGLGVSLSLVSVQVIDLVGVESDFDGFEEVEDGYTASPEDADGAADGVKPASDDDDEESEESSDDGSEGDYEL